MSDKHNDLIDHEFVDLQIPSPTDSFLEALGDFDSAEGLASTPNSPPPSSDTNQSASPEMHSTVPNNDSRENTSLVAETHYVDADLKIIAEPCYTSKLRTRSDYSKENRRHTLKAKGPNLSFNGPAIRIAPVYINAAETYYIGIFLVTVMHEKTRCRYFHPYELEDIENAIRNATDSSLWYPINTVDSIDIQSFPNLRIAKRKEKELEQDGNLRVFPGYVLDSNLLSSAMPERIPIRRLIQEYNLKKTQLAFTIGKKQNATDEFPVILDPRRIVFSTEMEDNNVRGRNEENEVVESNAATPDLKISKYAPHYGDVEGNEDMLLLFSQKLGKLKLKDFRITFDGSQLGEPWWTHIDSTVEVTGQLVSFKTPSFPYSLNQCITVAIRVQCGETMLEPLKYEYRPKFQCSTCQENITMSTLPFSRTPSNKRPYGWTNDDESDAVVPVGAEKSALQHSNSEPEPASLDSKSPLLASTHATSGANAKFQEEIDQSVVSLFTDNDYKPFLRICRAFVRHKPDLLHRAIDNDHSHLLSQFIPGTRSDLFQFKNDLGESVLLHAVRLNRLTVVSALLDRQNVGKLLEDVNSRGQNIMHVVAMERECAAILDLLVRFCLERSIDIREKFDSVDRDNHTPLQLSIVSNNLPAARVLLNYFDKNVRRTNDGRNDNLVHLVVRHGDLAMLKYVLDVEELKDQGTEANATITPIKLAQSMKRDEMVEHFNKIYSQLAISKSDDAGHE